MVLYPAEQYEQSLTHTPTYTLFQHTYTVLHVCVTCGADLEHDGGFGFDSFSRAEIVVLGFHCIHHVTFHMVPNNKKAMISELILNISL